MSLAVKFWDAPKSGVQLRRFQASDKPVRAIMGPVGSGKTTTSLVEIMRRAVRQAPSPDGIRRTKWAVIRDTYRNLEKTTIPSWLTVVPKQFGEWKGGGGGEPATHTIRARVPGVGMIEAVVMFIAIGDNNVEDVLRGLELTGALLEEADRLVPEVFNFLRGRVGRYPSRMDGGCTWSGIWMVLNAPDTDNWFYELMVEKRPESFDLFVQPSGLSAEAENIENLPEGYYQQQCDGQPDWYIRRMIRNQFGFSREGKPVFPQFDDKRHVAPRSLSLIKGKPLVVGLDAGRTPAAIAMQTDAEGQVRWMRELCAERVHARQFGEMLDSWLARTFGPVDVVGVADPSAQYANDTSDASWIEIVSNAASIPVVPAETNDLTIRLDAINQLLMPSGWITPDKPGFLLSPDCVRCRRGFNSGYQFKRVKVAGGERYGDKPDKNDFSHPMDAGQYGTMHITGYMSIIGRGQRGHHVTREENEYDPLAL